MAAELQISKNLQSESAEIEQKKAEGEHFSEQNISDDNENQKKHISSEERSGSSSGTSEEDSDDEPIRRKPKSKKQKRQALSESEVNYPPKQNTRQTLFEGGDSEQEREQAPLEGEVAASTKENRGKKRKYDLVVESDEDEMDWVLPDELSDFFVKHCSKFMPRKKRKALIEEKHKCNPPSNLMKAPKLDSFVTSTLAGKGLGKVSSIDKELVENFEQCSEIMGPLGKAWLAVENFRSEPSEETQIDIHQLALNLKVAVMMVGQSCHKITHSRRQNALKALSNDDLEQAKSLLKQNSDCLESETRKLFGEEFQNVLKATTKESKSTIEYFEHMESLKSGKGKGKGHGEKGKGKGKASWGTTVKPPIIPPFQGNLYANGSYGRGQQKFGAYQAMGRGQQQNKGGYRGGFRGGYGTPPWKSGKKIKSIKFRISPFAKNPNTREISPSLCKVDPSANKKRGSVKNWGEDLVLSKKLEEADQGQSYLGHGPRIPNSTCGKASSNQKTSRHKHECGRKMGSDGRDSKNAYKRCGRSNHTRAGPVFKQRVCKAKARKQTQGDIKPERTKQMCQVSPFQDGDHKRHKTSFAGRRLSDKDRPSGCILECPSESRIKKTDAVRMGGDYVRVQDPGLRPRTCTSSLYQIDEDPNLPDEELGSRLMIFLDDILLAAQTLSEAYQVRDTLIYLLENLGLTVNWKKSILEPVHTLEYLGMTINTLSMTIFLPERKIRELVRLCKERLTKKEHSLREMSQLIGKLYSTAPAIIPAPLQLRYLQQDLIKAQRGGLSYSDTITLSKDSKKELEWWIFNLKLQEGRSLLIQEPEMVIYSDAAKTQGWGAAMEGGPSTSGQWSTLEKTYSINALELMAAELAIKAFVKIRPVSSLHLWIDNQVALTYLMKMGGTKSETLTKISKSIWEFLLDKGITLTASWIPSKMNWRADLESRKKPNSSDWFLLPEIFQKIVHQWGTPTVDCFASRIMRQVPNYMSLNLDSESKGTNAMYQTWHTEYPYLFPPFCLIGQSLQKLKREQVEKATLIVPLWSGQVWFPSLLEMVIDHPLLLENREDMLTDTEGLPHPLVMNQTLRLGAFLVSGNLMKQKDYQKGLHSFSWDQSVKEQPTFTQATGKNGILGVVKGKQIPLIAI